MSFVRERTVKRTRVPRCCAGCGASIMPGTPMVAWAGMCDGDFGTANYHPDCRRAEVELNALHGTSSDEWMSLCDIEPEDFLWLKEAYPSVAARMNIGGEVQP